MPHTPKIDKIVDIPDLGVAVVERYIYRCLLFTFALIVAGSVNATSIQDYLIVANGDSSNSFSLSLSDSELGAIGSNGSTSPPGSTPAFPSGTRGPQAGVTLDGDVAITHADGTVSSTSNSEIHTMNNGPSSLGAQGIDCAASFNNCTDNGSQISSSNSFNKTAPTPSFSALANNNGVQGGVDHSDLNTQITTLRGQISPAAKATGTLDLSGTSGVIGNTTRTDTFSSGVHIIDIDTGGNDLSVTTANWVINGNADTFVIFRLPKGAVLSGSEANFLLGGTINVSNVLFYIDADASETSITFDNVNFFGFSFWDIGTDTNNVASLNNVRGCGQIVTDSVNLQNVSMNHCSFDVTVVPIPAAVWLFGSGIIGLFAVTRRKRRKLLLETS